MLNFVRVLESKSRSRSKSKKISQCSLCSRWLKKNIHMEGLDTNADLLLQGNHFNKRFRIFSTSLKLWAI